MGTPKYAQKETEFTQRGTSTAPGAPSEQLFDQETTLSSPTGYSSVWVIDFFATRDRLPAGFEENGEEVEINRKANKVAARRPPGVKRTGRLEESLYWLFSAAMLSYLLLEIIGH
jgi:hypothetical protein